METPISETPSGTIDVRLPIFPSQIEELSGGQHVAIGVCVISPDGAGGYKAFLSGIRTILLAREFDTLEKIKAVLDAADDRGGQ